MRPATIHENSGPTLYMAQPNPTYPTFITLWINYWLLVQMGKYVNGNLRHIIGSKLYFSFPFPAWKIIEFWDSYYYKLVAATFHSIIEIVCLNTNIY